jgi:threonyl-tRNA synthetase
VQELFPGTQVTIGPAIEDGFYYDFAATSRSAWTTWPDRARMKEIVDRDEPIEREVWDRDEAIAHFKSIGEHYKAEIIEASPPARRSRSIARGTGRTSAAARTCRPRRRPARPSS